MLDSNGVTLNMKTSTITFLFYNTIFRISFKDKLDVFFYIGNLLVSITNICNLFKHINNDRSYYLILYVSVSISITNYSSTIFQHYLTCRFYISTRSIISQTRNNNNNNNNNKRIFISVCD
jgi:hypothetical protein